MNVKWLVLLVVALFAVAPAAMAAEKRCKAGGEKVECPTQTKESLEKAAENFEKEAMNMFKGAGGATYGIAAFDYLTGVGKRTSKANVKTFEVESGYAKGTGKTEMWDRVKKPMSGEQIYNQWTNNWSPSFKTSLIPGANPNEGKQWYYVYCVGCHGWLLQGDGPNAAYLDPYPRKLTAGAEYMNKKTNVELFTVIKGGGTAVELSDAMPAWGNLLQDQDIWNVIAWIRANADVKPPKDIAEYLNPKSSFDPKSAVNAVTPLNAAKSAEFQEAQELLEATLAGRGGDLKGAGFVEGGLRKTAGEEAKGMK
ncbi:MAG TPA: cytochrome c [Thermodesulfobacteriota bacterium]|nr:cytochrome c [Thermodesulfobacteriota bacterium]